MTAVKEVQSKTLSGLLFDVKRSIAEIVYEQMTEAGTRDLNVLVSNINGMTMNFIKSLIEQTQAGSNAVAKEMEIVRDMSDEKAIEYMQNKIKEFDNKEGV